MRLRDAFLLESPPLPNDWDDAIFDQRVPFAQRVRYATERAEKVGKGSSRVAFVIPYQGRKTVLKIALNRKGEAQNEEEGRLLDDRYMQSTGMVIPLIDYDERNSRPTWIHTEFAMKITQKQLERYFGGVPMYTITTELDRMTGRSRHGQPGGLSPDIYDNEYYQSLADIVGNFGIPAGDFARKANWGLYKGEPVIIDLGYTDNTAYLYK